MDRDKDAKLTYEEFVEGSKQDPTIVQVCGLYDYLRIPLTSLSAGIVVIRWPSITLVILHRSTTS